MEKIKEIEIKIPNLGDAEETEVIEVSVSEGDSVNENDPLIVLESEKAAMEVPSDFSGKIKKIIIKEGESVKEGQPFIILEVEGSEPPKQQENEEIPKETKQIEKKESSKPIQSFSGIHAGPAVRKIARELEIDLKKIKGSGKMGMILKDDLKKFVHGNMKEVGDNYPDISDLEPFGKYSILKQSKISILGAKNLSNAWKSIPHVTHFEEVITNKAEAARKAHQVEENKKITPLAYIVKALAQNLKLFPIFNSSLVGDGEVMVKEYVNIGIAVSISDGLIVPVLKDADKLSILEIADKIKELSEKARSKKLLKKDLEGSTFSISSLGQMGGTGFTPIINPPEVAILSVSRSKNILTMENQKIVESSILPIALSYDHRVINGADAGSFMTSLKSIVEGIDSSYFQ